MPASSAMSAPIPLDTLPNAAPAQVGRSRFPILRSSGCCTPRATAAGGFPRAATRTSPISGAYGYAAELSTGKDTPSGHWEMAGVPVLYEWGYFRDPANTFPKSLLDKLIERGRLPGVLGNCHASGTEIIERLGEEHVRTGKPIVYTSADSVFQIAAHEEAFGLERLLDLCLIARELVDEYRIGRVIARPFVGTNRARFRPHRQPSRLRRATARADRARQAGRERWRGDRHRQDSGHLCAPAASAERSRPPATRRCSMRRWMQLAAAPDRSIVFSNFVDFDMLYGHRRDVEGYAAALEYFDTRMPALLGRLGPGDVVILSADHGCDPTWPGSDHTREHVPVLVSGPGVPAGSLGRRATMADIGQSLAAHFELPAMDYGTSFFH